MSNSSQDSHKKTSSVLERLGQKITNIKEDITDNLERRRQSQSTINSNQIHYTTRTNMLDDSLNFEKKPPTPPSSHSSRTSGKNRKENYSYFIREKEKDSIIFFSYLPAHLKL
jgi:hypothetical protein